VTLANIALPAQLLPRDGRFGSGPSKVPASLLNSFAERGGAVMGTSHRQLPVTSLVGRIRDGLATLFDLPEGYEVVLGNGGSTAFWDAAAFGLNPAASPAFDLRRVLGQVRRGDPRGTLLERAGRPSGRARIDRDSVLNPDVDAYCWPHNETSTGVMAPVRRMPGTDALHLIDGTSAAAGLPVDLAQTDAYYFAPQKGFGGEGGLWLAFLSPAALDRVAEIAAGGRWSPPSLDLVIAIDNSRKNQTYNTPAIATLWLLAHQIEYLIEHGGLDYATGRSLDSSTRLYEWADKSDFASPMVVDPAIRSRVVGTIDFDAAIDTRRLAALLRSNGILDTEPYRGLTRNHLRIGMYPAVDPDDVTALTECIDWLVARMV